MWYPINKGDQNSSDTIPDALMQRRLTNGLPNGWTLTQNDDGTISAFKNSRHIRDYEHKA